MLNTYYRHEDGTKVTGRKSRIARGRPLGSNTTEPTTDRSPKKSKYNVTAESKEIAGNLFIFGSVDGSLIYVSKPMNSPTHVAKMKDRWIRRTHKRLRGKVK